MGENDIPLNGITLRADLHRLFDACLFTFKPNGKVKIVKRDTELSEAYDPATAQRAPAVGQPCKG